MRKQFFLILGMIILLISTPGYSAEKTGTLAGKVVSVTTGQPLIGASVRVVDLPIGGRTDAQGRFKIDNIPAATQSLRITYVGFEEKVVPNLEVVPGKIKDIQVEMVESFVRSEEIVVRASYFEKKIDAATGTQTLTSQDIRKTPGVQEDVIRAVQLLPGVNVSAAGRNDLIVRGGAPFENLYIVDDIKVPNINHFGSQGSTGGPLSIINIDYVDDVEFSAGGFGARYGDKLSSMTNISLREGNREQFRGRIDLSATGVDASVEGPTGDKSSFFVSARRSYLDLLFKAAGFSFIPQYWDFQGKYSYDIDDNNSLDVLAIGVLDDVKLNNDTQEAIDDNSEVAVPSQDQYVFGTTWRHFFKSGYSKVIFFRTFTKFETFQNDSNLNRIFQNYSRESNTGIKFETELKLSETFDLIAGNVVEFGSLNEYDILIPGYIRKDDKGIPQDLQVDTNFRTVKNGTYATFSAGLGRWRLTAGARADYYNMTSDALHLSPRLAAFYYINKNMSITGSLGRYYQSPQPIWLVGAPEQELKALRADQMVIGWNHTPMEEVKVQIEAFYKFYDNYPARVWRPQAVLAPAGFDNVYADIPYGLEPISPTGKGTSRGVELFIQKKLSEIPVWGLFSATYSETNFESIEGKERPGSYDSRFITNLSVGWRPTESWELSGKFRLSTGVPTTPYNPDGTLDFTRYNEGERLPLNHQLDLRVDRKWLLKKSMLNTYIDIQNVYSQNNVFSRRFDYETGETIDNESIGILPSIGILYEF